MAQKISLNELKRLVKQIIIETEDEDLIRAEKYVDYMIDKYKDYKTIRKNILDNLVNSKHGRNSNSYIQKVWNELEKRFPS